MTEHFFQDLASFPFRVSIGCRHTDLDILKSIHSVAIADIFEEARTLYSVGRKLKPAFDPHRRRLAALEIVFGEDARYPGSLDLGVGVACIGLHGWTIALVAMQNGSLIATCQTRFAIVDGDRPVALSPALTAILQADLLEGA